MGNNQSQFSDDELKDYEDLTYFSKKEILLWVFRLFTIDFPSVCFGLHGQKEKKTHPVEAVEVDRWILQ